MSTAALTPTTLTPTRSELEAHWMPFTANRQFKARPRILARASGMHYWTPEGRQILDGVAGLWCVNAGHGRREISEAVAHQLETMDYAPPFQMGHPLAFELANAVAKIAPAGLDHVFFTNSGSESVESALKIALAYHRVRGDAARTKLIGRERAYHGVNFGGISVGGISPVRKMWSASMIRLASLNIGSASGLPSASPGARSRGACALVATALPKLRSKSPCSSR